LLTLTLGGDPELDLVGFSDSFHADCPDTTCSTMGYCFSIGGAIFTWSSPTLPAKPNTLLLARPAMKLFALDASHNNLNQIIVEKL